MKTLYAPLLAALALSLAAFAGGSQAADTTPSSQGTAHLRATARGDGQRNVSASEVNGRADWNVDYPSQLAPQVLPSTITVIAADAPAPSTAQPSVAGR